MCSNSSNPMSNRPSRIRNPTLKRDANQGPTTRLASNSDSRKNLSTSTSTAVGNAFCNPQFRHAVDANVASLYLQVP
jgi:hypothetical protein